MAQRRGLVRVALCASLIGTASAWSLTPHDKTIGPGAASEATFSSDNTVKQPQPPAEHGSISERANGKIGDTPPPNSRKVGADNNKPAPNENPSPGDGKGFIDEATLAIAFLTLCVLIVQTRVFGLQAVRLRETIEAMKGIGEQQSADMKLSLSHAEASAQAALASVEMAKVEFIASHRAWIKVEARLSQFHIANRCAILTCFVSGVNIGFSPSVMTDIIFDEYDAINVYDSAEIVFNKLIEKRKIMRFLGGVVFPNERTHEAGILISTPLTEFKTTSIRRIIVGIFYTIAGDSEERITINAFDLVIKKNIASEPTIDNFALSGTIVGFAT